MKRLTISMSDELFDRLDEIENKSLFVRNIIDRELSSEVVFENDGLAERLSDVENQLESIQSMLQSVPSIDEIEKIVATVEARFVEERVSRPQIAVSNPISVEGRMVRQQIAEPDSISVERMVPRSQIAVPKSTIVGESIDQPLVSVDATNLPELESSVLGNASSSMPSALQQKSGNSDKIERNILMYMPHGAEIKRNIITSLLSKRYGPDDINNEINRLIGVGILSMITKDGEDHLVRA